jgi:hypothetical protein
MCWAADGDAPARTVIEQDLDRANGRQCIKEIRSSGKGSDLFSYHRRTAPPRQRGLNQVPVVTVV